MKTAIPGGHGSSSARYQPSAPRAGYLFTLWSCTEQVENHTSYRLNGTAFIRPLVLWARLGSAVQKGQARPLLPHPLFLEPLGGGGCEGRRCPQAGHMPACLGLSLLQESTPPPREKALPFFPAPTLLAAWPTSLPLATPSACLSIIRSGADKRSPYEPGHEIPLWEIKAWGLGNSVGSGSRGSRIWGRGGGRNRALKAAK